MFHVYFLASRKHGTIYIGVTNDLARRVTEHRRGRGSKFVIDHNVLRLVYVESFDRPSEVIAREKQLKHWNRDWKIRLIETDNLDWQDLSNQI